MWSTISDVTIKAQYVEVFVNTESIGLYRFGENYTEELLGLNNSSRLYTGIDNTEITKFEQMPDKKPESKYWKEWEQLYPNPSYQLEWDEFYNLSEIIVNSGNTTFKSEISQQIDIDRLIDYYLFINLCYGYDNVGKNWIFYKENKNTKFEILLWDVDATWGRKHNGEELNSDILVSNHLFTRLLTEGPSNFKQRVKQRWDELRNNQFDETSLLNRFNKNFDELKSYDIIRVESEIWGISVNLDTEEEYIQNWIQNRIVFLDDYFNKL